MNKQQTKAFTLVELIVVITILAILGTIAFISLQGYSADSRDSVRISDVSNMKTSLELFHLDAGKYPLPDDYDEVTFSGGVLWYQGTFWEQVLWNVSRNMSEVPLDPLMDKQYFYSVHNNKNELQILALLEGDVTTMNDGGVYAGNLQVIPRLDGNFNGLFVRSWHFYVPVPSIMTAADTTGGMELTSETIKSQITHLGDNIPTIWNVASNTWALANLKLASFSGTISSASSDADKVAFMDTIREAYSWSSLDNSGLIKTVLGSSGTWAITAMIDSVVLGDSTNVTSVSVSNTSQVTDNSSCLTILNTWWSTGSGTYTIDPDWVGWDEPYNVYCDMSLDGWWWTLILAYDWLTNPTTTFAWDNTPPTLTTQWYFNSSAISSTQFRLTWYYQWDPNASHISRIHDNSGWTNVVPWLKSKTNFLQWYSTWYDGTYSTLWEWNTCTTRTWWVHFQNDYPHIWLTDHIQYCGTCGSFILWPSYNVWCASAKSWLAYPNQALRVWIK